MSARIDAKASQGNDQQKAPTTALFCFIEGGKSWLTISKTTWSGIYSGNARNPRMPFKLRGDGMASAKELGAFQKYFDALTQTFLNEKTEHTDRDAIKALVQSFLSDGVKIVHEPRRVPGKGAPDFKLQKGAQIVGYAEAKPIGTDLDEVLASEQIARYKSLSKNILVTNYLDWAWMLGDAPPQRGSFGSPSRLMKAKAPQVDRSLIEGVQPILVGFVSTPPEHIARASDLANGLAIRSRLLRDFLAEELQRQEWPAPGSVDTRLS